MRGIASLVIFMLITKAACNDNVTTIEATTASISTSPSTSFLSTSTTIIPSSTAAPKSDNTTKLLQSPSNRTQFLNTTSYVCSCDLTVNYSFIHSVHDLFTLFPINTA